MEHRIHTNDTGNLGQTLENILMQFPPQMKIDKCIGNGILIIYRNLFLLTRQTRNVTNNLSLETS